MIRRKRASMQRRGAWIIALALLLAVCASTAYADRHGVILLYHHVGEQTPASTSVTPGVFAQHLDYLQREGFVVLPLATLLDALYGEKSVPENAVAITFDDAYKSVFTQAWPQLAKRRIPFTVFVATVAIDKRYPNFMSWEQMRSMDPALASFGAHSLSHAHLVQRRDGESTGQWRSRVDMEISGSVDRIATELGRAVQSFAYPYGEYDGAVADLVERSGLYGLTQQSGAAGPKISAREIPRFPMASGYDNLERFATAINARPLPVVHTGSNANVIAVDEVPTHTSLQLDPGPYRSEALACYSAAGERLALTTEDGKYRVTLPPLRPGRNKINCTAPSREKPGEYFWYSPLWIVTDAENNWLRH